MSHIHKVGRENVRQILKKKPAVSRENGDQTANDKIHSSARWLLDGQMSPICFTSDSSQCWESKNENNWTISGTVTPPKPRPGSAATLKGFL